MSPTTLINNTMSCTAIDRLTSLFTFPDAQPWDGGKSGKGCRGGFEGRACVPVALPPDNSPQKISSWACVTLDSVTPLVVIPMNFFPITSILRNRSSRFTHPDVLITDLFPYLPSGGYKVISNTAERVTFIEAVWGVTMVRRQQRFMGQHLYA